MKPGCPSVTALLPACDAAAFIGPTLQSLAAQAYPRFQVLISVDASADDTADHCQRVVRDDPRFAVVRQEKRLGWIRNASELLRRADSELCFFISHDDMVEPGYVEALVAALGANPRAVLAYADMEVTWPDGSRVIRRYPGIDGVTERLARGRLVLARGGSWATTYRGIFRTAVARRGRPLRVHLAGEFAADWPFLLHLALQGECVRVPRVLYRKRRQAASVSASWRVGVLQWLAVDLSCASLLMESDLGIRERTLLLAALAGRVARDIARRLSLQPGPKPRRGQRP